MNTFAALPPLFQEYGLFSFQWHIGLSVTIFPFSSLLFPSLIGGFEEDAFFQG